MKRCKMAAWMPRDIATGRPKDAACVYPNNGGCREGIE